MIFYNEQRDHIVTFWLNKCANVALYVDNMKGNPMGWTIPKTWAAEPLTSADMNTYIRDNQNHLYDRLETGDDYILDESTVYSTTSTSFVDIDNSVLNLTITTHGGNVLVGFSSTIYNAAPTKFVYLDVEVDGSRYFGDDGIINPRLDTQNYAQNFSFVVKITGLSAGSHTFKMQWKVEGGTAFMYNGAGTTEADTHGQFWVQEI